MAAQSVISIPIPWDFGAVEKGTTLTVNILLGNFESLHRHQYKGVCVLFGSFSDLDSEFWGRDTLSMNFGVGPR